MSIFKSIILLIATLTLFTMCKNDEIAPAIDSSKLLVGQWNDYENGNEQTGFRSGITTGVTLYYENGLSFLSDGTFTPRYHINDEWTDSGVGVGPFKLNDKIISMTFSPNTKDEIVLYVHVVKLDEQYLWIKHSYFGIEQEYHLKRASN